MFIAHIIRKTKNEELGSDFFMWEKDADLNNCRGCQGPFTVSKRRHHCRLCGGIFCDTCSLTNIAVNGETFDRVCNGCLKGETPGDNVRGLVEKRLKNVTIPAEHRILSAPITLSYGSQFDLDSKKATKATTVAPSSGYFEFINKTSLVVCLKLVIGTSGNDLDTLWEIPRPSYVAVPPNVIVNCNFPPKIPFFELYILLSNPNPFVAEDGSSGKGPSESVSVVYDTTTSLPSSPIKVSPCASVSLFRQYTAFRIRCKDSNVMLKYKLDGVLEPRAGNSIARVGIFGKLMGSNKSSGGDGEAGSELDFSTNITPAAIERI